MAYTRHYENDVGWEDLPSVATPINATNLNKMDDAIGAIDANAYTEFAAVHQEAQQIATTSAAGRVKPDGTSISVANDGTISATNGMPENPLGTAHGGTGNADGYIRTGLASGVTAGTMSTAEGYATRPTGDYAHAEGYAAYATGDYSHCEGRDCQSGGDYSHAGGQGVAVSYDHQTAIGKFNDNKSGTLFEVGNGTGTNVRSNALEVYANGNVVAGGDITDGYGNKLSDVVIRKSVTQSGTVSYISISSYTPHANDILALSIMNNISVSSSAGEWDISYDGGQTRYPIIKNGNTFNEALAAGTCLLVIWDGSAAFLLINTWDAVEANPSGTATGTLNKLQVGGTIYGMPTAAIATDTTPGIVCPDNVTITIDSYGNIYVPRASSSHLGAVQVDGTTITANSSGVISASGSGMPENPLGIAHGGTGNADGFIRAGQKSGTTIGDNASANGYDTTASGNYSFATGLNTQATGSCSFVIGDTTKALKSCSFAGGYNSQANGLHSFAMGRSVYTTQDNQTVFGIFNDNQTDTLFEIGNGTASNARSNAFQVHSNGNIVAGGTISDANGTLNAVAANPSGTASTALTKLQIGSTVYSVSGMPADPLPIANGGTGNTAGYIRTGQRSNTTVGTASTIEGADNSASGDYSHSGGNYASNTGDYSFVYGFHVQSGYDNQFVIGQYNDNQSTTLFEIGDGGITERKNAFEVHSGGIVVANIFSDPDGTLKAVEANPSGSASTSLTKLKVGSTVYSISGGSGSGNTKSKTRYSISYGSWSSSKNSDGFYTYSLTLSTTLDTSYAPTVSIAGASNTSQPTDTHRRMYQMLAQVNLSASNTLVLYASVKPTSTFYIFVDGVNA